MKTEARAYMVGTGRDGGFTSHLPILVMEMHALTQYYYPESNFNSHIG